VNYAMSGTAMLNSDYTMSAAQITIPAGQNSGTITLSALVNNVATRATHRAPADSSSRPMIC
jgi:hypothetical protein